MDIICHTTETNICHEVHLPNDMNYYYFGTYWLITSNNLLNIKFFVYSPGPQIIMVDFCSSACAGKYTYYLRLLCLIEIFVIYRELPICS